MKYMTLANTAHSENIPQFIAVSEYSIQDRITGKTFDCHHSSQVRAACDMYKFYSYPSKINKVVYFIERLYYLRVTEYLVKHEMPYIEPNPFDNYNKLYCNGDKLLLPDKKYSNDRAKIIVKLFTSNDINIALSKCRITGGTAAERKIEWEERRKKEKQVIENKNNDLFIMQDETNNNKDDSLHSVLFDGIDNSDFNALRERCKLIRNIVHLHTCNNAGLERILSEKEKAIDNYLLEKDKQEIKSCLDLDNVPPERIKEILKLIKGGKGSLK